MIDPGGRLRLAEHLWGWTPHETQKDWLLCNAKVKVAACGRRWGKTEAAAVDAATLAITQPGAVQMILAPTYDQSRLLFGAVERLMLGARLTRPFTTVLKTPYPKLTITGSVITARTTDEDGRNLRGNSADRVIIDEAAYVRDSVVQEVVAPMLADRDGQLVMISTPFGKNHFYRAFVKGQANGERGVRDEEFTASFQFPSWENPHISREYIERQRSELSARQFAVEYEAQFVDDSCSVFPWEEIEAAASHRQRTAGYGAWDCVVAGIDWARYSDYTALVAVGVTNARCEVLGIDRFNGIGWGRQIERVVEFLRTHRVNAALADSTSIGDPLLEQLRAKLWESGVDTAVDGYGFTNASKRELVDGLAMRFAHATVSIPRDERLMRELQYFEYELTDSGTVRLNARSGCTDDLVIALALACKLARGAATGTAVLGRSGRMAVGSEW